MAPSEAEVAWLAGILEGEGSFGMISSHVNGKIYRYPKIVVNMTDRDIIDRVSQMFGGSTYPIPPKPGRKPAYRSQISGRGAAVWMHELYPWMGTRRKAKIDEVMKEYGQIEPTSVRRRRACSEAAAGRPRLSGRFGPGVKP